MGESNRSSVATTVLRLSIHFVYCPPEAVQLHTTRHITIVTPTQTVDDMVAYPRRWVGFLGALNETALDEGVTKGQSKAVSMN